MTVYLDSSAAAKLLVDEDESAALATRLDELTEDGEVIVASVLLETELRRLAIRVEIPQSTVSTLLEGVVLHRPDRPLFHAAGVLTQAGLRSLDALHLATALRIGANEVAVYDARLAAAARSLGLRVLAPS